MSKRWFRIYHELLDDFAAQTLSGDMFKAAFVGALAGEDTPISRFVSLGRDRLSGEQWLRLRSAIFKRDNYTCSYCGERGGRLECDHIVPVSRGGEHEETNLTTACFGCNRSKRDKTVEEWLQ